YFGSFFIAPSSQRLESPRNPGRFKASILGNLFLSHEEMLMNFPGGGREASFCLASAVAPKL
ncbi:hypothetical protein AO272_09615, partial [Pseudomonas syringae pv. cerasicola]